MTNHPNRSKRLHTVTVIRDGNLGGDVIGRDLSRQKAFDAAKKAAGRGAQFSASYGPTSCAYIGREVTAVIAW